jgi:thiamine biosynthesis lipoprotein
VRRLPPRVPVSAVGERGGRAGVLPPPPPGERRVLIPVVVPPLRPPGPGPIVTLTGEAMGTSWTVKLVRPPAAGEGALRATVQAALDRVVGAMSTWEPGSAISRFNAAAAGSRHAIPEEFRAVLACALRVAEATDGAFDPTVGPAVDLWGFGPAGRAERPGAADVARAGSRVGWRRLGPEEGGLILQPGGISLDLSGIAKGYAVDLVSDRLAAAGVASFLVEIGGELRGFGVKPDLSPWWVALEHPADAPPGALPHTVVALHGLAVATSGDYRRFAGQGRERYSHTVDPRTGAPVANRLASVSVLHRSCMEADALATALMVMGPQDGIGFAARRDIAALFVERTPAGLREHGTPALARMADQHA